MFKMDKSVVAISGNSKANHKETDMQKRYNTWCFFHSRKELQCNISLDNNSSIKFVNYGSHCEPMNCHTQNGIIYGVEIITSSDEKAAAIADILCASHTVVDGYNHENAEDIIQRFDMNPSYLSQAGKPGVFYGDDSLMYSCFMLKKVYGNQIYENAICKYHVAHDVYSYHPMNLHPMENLFKSTYLLSERIRIANVVVDCYSVLEELHTQIIASRENPSAGKDGKWNPAVKKDLCDRLMKKHIDPETTIPWLTRNGILRPFKSTLVSHSDLCEWSDGTEICDFNINICDAILELSFMRSQMASHKLDNKVINLTVYDADNAFSLARNILLRCFEIDSFSNDNCV